MEVKDIYDVGVVALFPPLYLLGQHVDENRWNKQAPDLPAEHAMTRP
jgi:hypothetical protein